jgi:hypothetical protein
LCGGDAVGEGLGLIEAGHDDSGFEHGGSGIF